MNNVTKLEPIPENWDTALAVVAHPDDLEYGAASAVARWTAQGKRITYLLLTRGEAGIDSIAPEEAGPLREAEQRASASEVGVQDVEFLDFQDGIIEYSTHLRRDIGHLLFWDLLRGEKTRMEDNLSKAKGKKEKDKLKNQAKGKKQVAAKQITNIPSKS